MTGATNAHTTIPYKGAKGLSRILRCFATVYSIAIMSTKTPKQEIDAYLPANLQMSTDPGPVERFLRIPFIRQAEIWLTDE